MAKFWDDFSKWLDDASRVISKEAGDLTLKGKLKLELFELQRNLKEEFHALGKLTYDQFFIRKSEDWQHNKKVTTIIRKIRSLTRQLKIKEAGYKKIGK
ncbi:MAG TPA: hypothetical protein VF399_00095 [bacterium]